MFYILPKVGVDMGKSFDRLSSSIFTIPDKKPRSCIIETLTDQVTDLTVQCVARATSVAEKNHRGKRSEKIQERPVCSCKQESWCI